MGRLAALFLFVATLLSGLSAGLALSHVLEIAGKHSLNGSQFLRVQHTFYGGYAIFGEIVWILVPLISLIIGFQIFRRSRKTAIYCFIAAACFILSLGIFGIFLAHYNGLIASWNPSNLPANWRRARDHWETAHAIIFVLLALAFGFLIKCNEITLKNNDSL